MRSWLRSLRLRLQAWHALILLVVVLGFGSVLYREIARSRWEEVDAELLSAARMLEGALRAVPRTVLNNFAQDADRPRRPPPRPFPPRPDRRPRDMDASPRPVPPGDRDWGHMLDLPDSLLEQMGRGDGPAYFIVWRGDGSILRQANLPYEALDRPRPRESPRQRRHVHDRQRGPLREVFLKGPGDTLICVGRSVRGEHQRLANLAAQFVLAGVVILSGGLLGGWWLSRSAIAPIERMSQTAGKISPANLSERMDLTGVDLELEQLGAVLNNMLERLDTAFTAQQRFTADASHELRTPLAVMLSTLELALSKPRSPEEYREQLVKCQRAAVRMHGLIDALLTLARTDNEAHATEMQTVALHEIVQENVDALRPLARERQVELSVSCAALNTSGNATQLGQVVANLVQNAIVYNHPGGRVEVELQKGEESSVMLTVRDTGQGIADADLPHIFERFYRVDAARSRAQGGSGLGLAICQRIVALHGGTIEVNSELGVGSSFTVKLP